MPLIDDIQKKVELTINIDGSFNPSIFQPYWFEKMKILKPDEIEGLTKDSKIIVHQEVAIIRSTFFNLRCTQEKFSISSRPYEFSSLMIDVVTGIFTILNQTPISAVEFMADIHFTLKTDDGFKKIVNYTINGFEDVKFINPKLTSIAVVEDVEEDEHPHYIRIDECRNSKRHIQLYVGRDFHLKYLYGPKNYGEVIPEFLDSHAFSTFESLITRIKQVLDYDA